MKDKFVGAAVTGAGYAAGAVVVYKASEKIGQAVSWGVKKSITVWNAWRAPKTSPTDAKKVA